MKEKLTGLIAAPFTPMHPDGSLHVAQIAHLAAALQTDGIRGAFICGTTGEGVALTLNERLAVAQEWHRVAGPELAVIVHVGHLCLADAKILAAQAQELQVAAIAAIAPSYFQAPTLTDLVAFFAEITAAAPTLPFYYYHIPAMTHVTFRAVDFLAAAMERLPTLAGIKFTHEDLADFSACLHFANGRYDILFGRDEILLAGLALGARGAVGSTYNFAGPLYTRLIAAFRAGDVAAARDIQEHARQMIELIVGAGGLAAQKAVMAVRGLDCGPVRLPLRSLTPAAAGALHATLTRAGYFATPAPLSPRGDAPDPALWV